MAGMGAAIAAVLLGIGPGVALAQAAGTAPGGAGGGKDGSAQEGGTARVDAMVLSKVHEANLMEMQAGQLATQRGASEGVRSYGGVLFRDHRTADGKIEKLAKRRGLELSAAAPSSPQEMEQMKQQMASMEKLKTAQGPEFDRVFLTTMIAAHEKAISMLEDAEQRVSPQVAALLSKLVPILKQHLALAQHLAQKTQASS